MQRDLQQSSDPLDDLLAQAHSPEPSPAAIDRLEDMWDRVSPSRRRSRRPILAMAATVLIAGTTAAILLSRQHASHPPIIAVAEPPQETAAIVLPASFVPRSPTPLEALAIRKELARPPLLAAKQGQAAIDDALQQLARQAGTDPAALAADLQRRVGSAALIANLRKRAESANDPAQSAAIRMLAFVGTEDSATFLVPLLRQPRTRQDALTSICRLASLPMLWRLLPAARDDAERRQLIAAALQRDPAAAMGDYLRLVEDPRTRAVALDALDQMNHPPVQQLIAALNTSRVTDRLSAARALGHIDGPYTTAQLVSRIQNNVNRREALAALLLSRGNQARIAVAEARQNSALAPILAAVQSEFTTSELEP
ncbi:MAG TPA: hypothetical protein VH370_15890 [Humisphaera sp.]|jgi:hypothetical protein|nr:hypothetical protein [Humisphaera sp.]